MRKGYLLAALATIAFAGCTNDDDVFTGEQELQKVQTMDNAVQFNTFLGQSASTRAGYAGSIDTDVLKAAANGFGVFAYYTGKQTYSAYRSKTISAKKYPNFMYNEHVYYDETNTAGYITHWKYDLMKYWPNEVQSGAVDDQDNAATTTYDNGGNLTFFAYAPYVQVTQSSDATGVNSGKVSPNTDGIMSVSGNQYSGNGTTRYSDPYITYGIPANGKKVVDLLWGTLMGTSQNVLGTAQNGVTGNAAAGETAPNTTKTDYADDLLHGYQTNADLTKQKTNGTVGFAFKHATSRVGGSGTKITTSKGEESTNNGLMIVLDIDDQKGAETGGKKADDTKVTVSNIKIEAKSLVPAGNKTPADGATYTETWLATGQNSGIFNLATGKWEITGTTTTTSTSAAVTTHEITTTGEGDNIAGKLSTKIAEPSTWNATWAQNPKGVEIKAENAYASEAAPLVFIPGTYPDLTITITYYVRTKDTKLAGGYSYVPQTIAKRVKFLKAVELNKQYNLLMHLGLTSVKFTATVSDWDVQKDNPNLDIDDTPDGTADIEVTDVYLPINVADAAAAAHAATSFEYTAETPGSDEYTYFGTTKVDGSEISYSISKTTAAEEVNGTKKIVGDLARLLGALYRMDNGATVQKLTYSETAYTWNASLNLKGSNWADASNNTLVSKIATDCASLLSTAGTKDIVIYLNDKTTTDPITIHAATTE